MTKKIESDDKITKPNDDSSRGRTKVAPPASSRSQEEQLTQGKDYYFNEAGLMVFTAEYHRKRGYCCGSGCRHCPYDHANVPRR